MEANGRTVAEFAELWRGANRNAPPLAPDDASASRNATGRAERETLRHLDKSIAALKKAAEIIKSGNYTDPPEVLQGWLSAILKEVSAIEEELTR
jgi:hypothetical protein